MGTSGLDPRLGVGILASQMRIDLLNHHPGPEGLVLST